ncbi:hypothetical protein ABID21_004281 [Pseudorhizobium tarimense]|uniref:Uncharacterized protein n=1 Tax=Pseudorhizobium tarimense TaxID=1079109 RepID=A0ABV2HC78_9HYPH|nr:hypothetical protein [Pseudorhizobium tarimense]MCJ8521191.1 hypothetical protein [Pseudorhizobium tarimense]
MSSDLTISEVLSDPLIGLMLKADGLDRDAFADLLGAAARDQLQQKLSQLREQRATHFYARLSDWQATSQHRSHC